ncbi:MAG: hypothetical protein ACXQT3_06190, partial [Methermicoccaceae archaeon]
MSKKVKVTLPLIIEEEPKVEKLDGVPRWRAVRITKPGELTIDLEALERELLNHISYPADLHVELGFVIVNGKLVAHLVDADWRLDVRERGTTGWKQTQ